MIDPDIIEYNRMNITKNKWEQTKRRWPKIEFITINKNDE